MADKKFSKKTFGETYYPITQNAMSSTRFKKFTGNKEDKKNSVNRDQLDKYHKELKEKLYKENVRPSEIAKLDKEYKARMKRANDDLQYKLANRPGMKAEKKKQKGTIPDTGSEFAKGGRVGLKKGTRDHGGTTLKLKKKKFGIFGDSKEDQKKYYNMTRASARDMNKTGQGDRFRKATKVDKETGQIKLAKRENKSNGGRTNYRGGGLATSGYGKVMKS